MRHQSLPQIPLLCYTQLPLHGVAAGTSMKEQELASSLKETLILSPALCERKKQNFTRKALL